MGELETNRPPVPASPCASGVANNDEVQRAISRAKQDWECTADTLPHVVCLLDDSRRVMRANRAIESWNLGRVNEVIGSDIHQLLHPRGCPADCALGTFLDAAWGRNREGFADEFELLDPATDRAVSVILRPIRGGVAGERGPGQAHAVVVVTDVTPLRFARIALEELNESLEVRVLQRTRELESANRDLQNEIARREAMEEQLRLSRNELELLSQQLIQAQEKERRRIAQELHDSVGQSLSAIKYSLERAAELDRQGRRSDCQPLLVKTIGRVRDTMREIRSIAMDLRPSVLDNLGVASALEWLCREFAETYAHIEVHTNISVDNEDIPDRLITTIFRCAHELLNNVAKHARATHISVALFRDSNTVALIVCDDGIGLPPADSSGSFGMGHGIRNLRERAQMTGGKLILSGDHQGGTRAQLDWALAARDLKS
jgi:signal transduction histidine kinase